MDCQSRSCVYETNEVEGSKILCDQLIYRATLHSHMNEVEYALPCSKLTVAGRQNCPIHIAALRKDGALCTNKSYLS